MSSRSVLRTGVLAADIALGWLPRRAVRARAPVVVANGFPKSGTNLLVKTLVDGLGFRRNRWTIHEAAPHSGHGPSLMVGIDRPAPVAQMDARRWLRMVPPGSVVPSHVPCDESNRRLFDDASARMVIIIRDPRDVAVSLVSYVLDRPRHFLHSRLIGMSPPERLHHAIVGDDRPGGLPDLRVRFQHILGWQGWPAGLVVRFEDLVGTEGGGSVEAQRATLSRIAQHLDIALTPSQHDAVAARLFGGTHTFRSGQISTWRRHFGPEHIALTKHVAGDLLVELGYEVSLDW